jgi:hypothetical protein
MGRSGNSARRLQIPAIPPAPPFAPPPAQMVSTKMDNALPFTTNTSSVFAALQSWLGLPPQRVVHSSFSGSWNIAASAAVRRPRRRHQPPRALTSAAAREIKSRSAWQPDSAQDSANPASISTGVNQGVTQRKQQPGSRRGRAAAAAAIVRRVGTVRRRRAAHRLRRAGNRAAFTTLGGNQLTADSVTAAEQVASTQRVNTAHVAAILDSIARLTAEPDLRPLVLQEDETQQAPDACDVVVDHDDGIDEDADLQLLSDLADAEDELISNELAAEAHFWDAVHCTVAGLQRSTAACLRADTLRSQRDIFGVLGRTESFELEMLERAEAHKAHDAVAHPAKASSGDSATMAEIQSRLRELLEGPDGKIKPEFWD